MRVIAFDPALRCSGVAVFEHGCLTAAYSRRPARRREAAQGRGAPAWAAVADELWRELVAADCLPHVVVVEQQVVYPHARVDPNDIVQVAGVAGAVAAVGASLGALVVGVDPAAWKGQAPKHVVAARSREVLSGAELARVEAGATLDAWDAVGLGLWYLRGASQR